MDGRIFLTRMSMPVVRWDQLHLPFTIGLAALASLLSFLHFLEEHLVTAFGDAQARLLIARQVVDSVNPGFTQLGGIWPPLPQVAMLPFIWHDTLYASGVAGALVSMSSYLIAVVFLYKLIQFVTGNRWAALIGVVAFSTPNALFMQAAPMAEMPFIAAFVASVYFLARWMKDVDGLRYLILTAIAIALATLIRYEGWGLLVIASGAILLAYLKRGYSYKRIEDRYVIFASIGFFGIFSWLLWNWVIFGSPYYFAFSEYSPWAIATHAMAAVGPEDQIRGNFARAFIVYGKTTLDNLGWIVTVLTAVGLAGFLLSRQSLTLKVVGLILLFPFGFFVLNLYMGSSVVIWHPDLMNGANWGTRYGTLMLPGAGFLIGFLSARWPAFIKAGLLGLVLFSHVLVWQSGIISSGEAVNNQTSPEAIAQDAAGRWLGENYDRGLVLIQRFNNERLVFSSVVSLKKVVYEGSDELWHAALEDPAASHIDWIVMRRMSDGTGDFLWNKLRGSPQLEEDYRLLYQENGIEIYRIK